MKTAGSTSGQDPVVRDFECSTMKDGDDIGTERHSLSREQGVRRLPVEQGDVGTPQHRPSWELQGVVAELSGRDKDPRIRQNSDGGWKTTSLAPNPRKRNQLNLTIDKLNFGALGLYGRDNELKRLREILDQVSSGAVERQVILISGFSGAGKSALADSVKQHVVNKLHGLYVRGKFDVQARCEPYAGVAAAFSAICGHILSFQTQNPDLVERIWKRIEEDLGSELPLLIRFIPAMRDLIRTEKIDMTLDESIISSEEAKNRFHFSVQRLVRIISKEFAPFVLVLDDLQWADAPSIDLAEVLVSDQKTSQFILIGIYRSNEVEDTHIFYRSLQDFRCKHREGVFQMTEMEIGDLSCRDVDSLIGDLLSMDKNEKTMKLAGLCFKRTHGNVFFLLHFLAMLHECTLLKFNFGLMSWVWDIDEINSDTSISDNVVDLLKKKMAHLPHALIVILKVGACLGFTFEERTMRLVLENMSSELLVEGGVGELLKEGLVQLEEYGYLHKVSRSPSSPSVWTFCWAHDKIRESAESFVDQGECSAFSCRIGRVLASRMDKNELDSSIFVVVNLLNRCDACLFDELERIKVATLNYQASKKAVSLSAFESAAAYAECGINLLPKNHWKDHSDLSLGLFSIGAHMAGCLGYVATMERYCNEVISVESIPLEEKLGVYHTLIDHLCNQGKPAEAADLTVDILKKFGCRFPKKTIPVTLGVVGNVIKIKTATKSRSVDDLPGMMDPKRHEMLKLVDRLGICWYLIDDDRLPLASFRILNWTMKYGYSAYSSIAFASVAMILTGVLEDLQGGSSFGELAMKLAQKTPKSSAHARTLFMTNAFIFPWTVSLTRLQKSLLLAYDGGLQCGDPETSMWSILVWMLSRLVVGNSLEQLESDLLLYSRQMKDLKRVQQLYITKYVRQVTLNMMGQNDASLLELIGKAWSEEELERCKQDKFHIPGLIMYQGILLTYFGDHIRQADAAVNSGHDYLQKGYLCSLTIPYDHYLKAVSCYIAAGATKQRKYAKMGDKLRSKLKRWQAMGNPNVKHYNLLLDAEYAVMKEKHSDAIRSYEESILCAGRCGFQHDAAFASERLGELQLNMMHNKDEAAYRIRESIKYWTGWGALGKVRHLETKYSDLVATVK